MSKFKTELEAINEINRKIQQLNNSEGYHIKFLGFKNNMWLGPNKSIIIVFCLIHKEIKEFNYYGFVRKGRLNIKACDKCFSEKAQKEKQSKVIKIKEELILKINNRVSEINSSGYNISFLGFLDEVGTIPNNKLKLIIRCNVHDRTQYPILGKFLKKKYNTFCISCINHDRTRSNKEIFNFLTEKFREFPQYDFSKILLEDEFGSDPNRKITVLCKKHNEEFIRSYGQLIHSKDGLICKKCRKEIYFNSVQELKRDLILNAIEERKEQGIDISFLGFVGGKYTSTSTKLILRCNKCGSIWETTEFEKFTLGETINGCPTCSHKISYSTEQKCFNIVVNKLKIKAKRNHFIWIEDDKRKNGKRKCFIDIYIPDYNIYIEYNGKQHYEYVSYFHSTINEYYDQVRRDRLVSEYCSKNNIKLLSIPFIDSNKLEIIISEFINHGIDLTQKLIPEMYN